jgi:hypothetical protein
MSSLNKVQIIGNLGADPEIKSMQSGDKVANLSVATSEKWTDKSTGEIKEKTTKPTVGSDSRMVEYSDVQIALLAVHKSRPKARRIWHYMHHKHAVHCTDGLCMPFNKIAQGGCKRVWKPTGNEEDVALLRHSF